MLCRVLVVVRRQVVLARTGVRENGVSHTLSLVLFFIIVIPCTEPVLLTDV